MSINSSGQATRASLNTLRPQHRHWPTPIDKFVGSFKPPNRTSRDQTNGLINVPIHGRSGKIRSPKVQPTRNFLVGSQRYYQLCQPRTHIAKWLRPGLAT